MQKHAHGNMETYRLIIYNGSVFSSLDEIPPKIKRKRVIKIKSGTVYRVADISSFIPNLMKRRYRLVSVSSVEELMF
jgi:uncharacterized protein YjhX (UPF0386 family)